MPFILKSGLYLSVLAGVASSIVIPLTMSSSSNKVSQAVSSIQASQGGDIRPFDTSSDTENTGRGNSESLTKLVKTVLLLLKKGESFTGEEKRVEINRNDSTKEGNGKNFETEGTKERLQLGSINDGDLEQKMREAFEYVLQRWEKDKGTSTGFSTHGGTSWTDETRSKNIVMTGVDSDGKKNVLMKIDLDDQSSRYIVGLYDPDKGEVDLGLSGCEDEQLLPQCHIKKKGQLVDKRIQIVFS